jgi:alkylation response protein AidB-like acyl-CoA dehydrogenase
MLRAIAGGQLVICATATESGTDFLRPHTTATRTADGGWSLSGRKIFVTLSPYANVLAMNARVCEEGEPDRIGFAFVPMGAPGMQPQDDWDALGMRGSGSQSIVFEDCRVPDGTLQIAGEWGCWNPGLLMGRTLANLTLTAVFQGMAERARELAVEAGQRQSKSKFDGPIGQSAGVQHLLGEIDIELWAARAVLIETTRSLDALQAETDGQPPSLERAHECMRDYQCAKWTVNQSAIRIVSRAMDVCGGGAFMSFHELSRLYRDVRAGPFMQPFSPTEARQYVGQIALGLPPEG